MGKDLDEFNLANKLIEENKDYGYFAGEQTTELIEKAEKALNVVFPESYKQFLLQYGAGSFGSSEVYGVIKYDFVNSSVPDAVWLTMREREHGLVKDAVVIYSVGDGWQHCLLCNQSNEQNNIVSYYAPAPAELQKYETVFESFGEFLLEIVKSEISMKMDNNKTL
jgi:antitoxin YobK